MLSLFSSSKKKNESSTLPPLGKTKADGRSVAEETFGMEDDDDKESTDSYVENKNDEDQDNYDYRKPYNFDAWIRSMDSENAIYFYNIKTGESTWLGPCGICCKPSDKYCIDCKQAYCDNDFKKRHEKRSRQKHHWQRTDVPNPPKLQRNEVCCIECSLKVASLMCMECFDPYCTECFGTVHYVGALRHHPTMPYEQARRGWVRIRGETVKDSDMFSNGSTGVTTYEKPLELMNPLERRMNKEFRKCEKETKALVAEIEQLQFDVEGTKYERDRVWADSQVTLREMHSKHIEKSKPKEGNLLDHSKLKGGKGWFGGVFGGNAKEQLYKDKLLNPTTRRRGEARTAYIRDVLETAAGIKAVDSSDGSALK